MMTDDQILEMMLAENPAVKPTDYSTGLTDMTSQPSLDDLMFRSYRKPIISAPITPVRQRVDPETMRPVFPSAFQRQRPQNEIPRDVDIKSKIASSTAGWDNFFRNLGRRGRQNPQYTDPNAASSAVINDFLQRSQSQDTSRRADIALALQKKKLDLASQPKPVDPIAQMKAIADLRTAQAGAKLKEREVEQTGTEEDRKKELVGMINASMEKEVASMSMSLKTLEAMASDIGLDPLKLRRAKAAGGGSVSGKDIAYSTEKQPQLALAVARAAKNKSRFLADPADREAYSEVMQSDMSPKQKREVIEQQGWNKEIERTQDRLYRYADETLKKISAPENGVAKMFGAINDLQRLLEKYPDVPGWNAISSTANSWGKLGQWAVDLSNYDEPAQREIMSAVRKYNEAYRRIYSGAAIADHEKADFAGQLGAGAFGSPAALKQGVDNAEKVLRDGINNTFMTIDERIQPEYRERVKHFLPPQAQDAQSIADKYRGK
jgi:hypothetical protein